MNINNIKSGINTSNRREIFFSILIIFSLVIKFLGLCCLIFNLIKLYINENNITLVAKDDLLKKIVKMNDDNKLFNLLNWLLNTFNKSVNYFNEFPLMVIIIMCLIIIISMIIDIKKIMNPSFKNIFFYKLISSFAMIGSFSSIRSIYFLLNEHYTGLNIRSIDVVLDFSLFKLVFSDNMLEKKNIFINNYFNKLNELFSNKNLMSKDKFELFINSKKEMLDNFLSDNYISKFSIEDLIENSIKLALNDYNVFLANELSYFRNLLNNILSYDKVIMGVVFLGICSVFLYYFTGKLNVLNSELNAANSELNAANSRLNVNDSRFNLLDAKIDFIKNKTNSHLFLLNKNYNVLSGNSKILNGNSKVLESNSKVLNTRLNELSVTNKANDLKIDNIVDIIVEREAMLLKLVNNDDINTNNQKHFREILKLLETRVETLEDLNAVAAANAAGEVSSAVITAVSTVI